MGVTLAAPSSPSAACLWGDVCLPLLHCPTLEGRHLSPEGTDMGVLWDDTGGWEGAAARPRLEAVRRAFGIPSLAPVRALPEPPCILFESSSRCTRSARRHLAGVALLPHMDE